MLNNLRIFFLNDIYVKRLIIIGIIFRVILFLMLMSVTRYPDTEGYEQLSRYFLKFLKDYNGTRSPGYPFVIALFGGKHILVVFFQFFLGIVTWVFWYKTFLNLKFSNNTSFLTTLFLGSFIHLFFYETTILIESVSLFVMSWIFYLISSGFLGNTNKKENWLMAFLVAYLVLLKPFYAFIPFVIYGFTILKNFSFIRVINHKALIVLSALFCYFGWSYVNKLNTGHFVSTTYFGLNLAQNCVYFAENTSEEYQEFGKTYAKQRQKAIQEEKDVAMSVWYGMKELQTTANIEYFPDFSAYLGEYAKTTITLNKEEYLKQVVTISWLDFWKVNKHWNSVVPKYSFSKTIFLGVWKVQRYVLMGFRAMFLFLIPFYIFKFIKTRKISFEIIVVAVTFSASVLQAIVTFGTNSRYSYPFEYLMIIVVLMFAKSIYKKKKTKS